MASRKQNNILVHIVDIGDRKIKIPVAQFENGIGPSVLITAGMDGDEYSGIEAAYALIEYFSKQKFVGNLFIIPVVNIPGFEAAVSWNPIDTKYPKHIFPGKETGSNTERLMHWVTENFVSTVDVWIDLHSGASTEALDPFVWVWKTSKKDINALVEKSLQKIKSDRIIYQQEKDYYSENIAKKKTAYILLESGELGQRKSADVKQHVEWVKQLLSKNSYRQARTVKKQTVYTNVSEIVSQYDGVWVPMFSGKNVKKGTVLGEVRTLDGKVLQKVMAKESGVFLWRREAMSCKKGNDLYAYGFGKQSL